MGLALAGQYLGDALLYTESTQLGAVAGAIYVFVTGVVASYIGWATWDDVAHDNKEKS